MKRVVLGRLQGCLARPKTQAFSDHITLTKLQLAAYPGTGKTTVAKLFSEILEAAGVRSGNKFIKMTAAQALRKGSEKFATELSSLTGGDTSVGPPRTYLMKGMDVEVSRLIKRSAEEEDDTG